MKEHIKLIGSIIVCLIVITITLGFSYAFYMLEVSSSEDLYVDVTAKKLGLKFENINEINESSILPGATLIKKFKVTNEGNVSVAFNIYLENTLNEIREDIVYYLYDGNNLVVDETLLPPSSNSKEYLKSSIMINPSETKEYTLKIIFKNMPYPQDELANKNFISKVGIDALDTEVFQNGILLDVARRYYTVDEIKEYIDLLAKYNGSYLQIHFTDNENVAIESVYLGQTTENASFSDGIYTNNATNKPFLSISQVNEIMAYAKNNGVLIIPEFDVPSHMGGIKELARIKFGDEFTNKIFRGSGSEATQMDIITLEGKEFVTNIYHEYTELFKGYPYFHVGFDEYTYRIDEKPDFMNYLHDYLTNKGFKMIMWNDSLTDDMITSIPNDIIITYWNYFGSRYQTVDELSENGFKILLTNSYYLFYVPSLSNSNQADLDYMVNDILTNWDLNRWNVNETWNLTSFDNLKGNFIAIWGENSTGVDTDLIFNQSERMFKAMVKKSKYQKRG